MVDVEIKRGYEVLPDNNVRFGIRITNVSDLAISDVEVILDYSESLFKLERGRMQKVGVIPPSNTRTAEFILKPLGCVHKVNIEALISFRDATYARQRIDMHPKEVHCVCPFLKGKAMSRAEFLKLSNRGHSAETGLNFKGVSVERLASYLVQTCKNRHYKVNDFSVDGGRMLYLASESIGEKAYYLLTALIKEDDGLTQVMLRVASDKPHGLNGYLNETMAELRHVTSTVQSAQEIGIIKKQQVINIIDSVVQRTNFGGSEGSASVNVLDSVVQRTEFNAGEGKKVEEERLRKEQEKAKRKRKEKEILNWQEAQRKAREEQEHIAKKKSKTHTNISMLAIVLGALFIGFVMFAPGLDDVVDTGDIDETTPVEPEVVEETPAVDSQTYPIRLEYYMVKIPSPFEIDRGDTIVWRNAQDPKRRLTLVSEDELWEDTNLVYGRTFVYTFNKSGTYNFSVLGQPRMSGSILVN